MGDDFVVDASVVMAWCFEDGSSLYADRILKRLRSGTGFVPAIWCLEVGNVLLVAQRKGRISEADSARFLMLLSELPIVIEQELGASYPDLAMRKGLPLATTDKILSAAAKRSREPILRGTRQS
ncbi:MAG: type II toxin-antitoxin system VapC family toxin [Thermodesulfobacteriota bacterium]